MERISVVDIARGFAILQMAFWQVFDFFATKNVYADAPFFLKAINAPIHFSVLVLFLSMSGAGIVISSQSRKTKGYRWRNRFFRVVKKYGFFILVSAFFTTLMWDFCTFQTWSEAIQGVGLTAIVSFIILSFKPSKKFMFIIISLLVLIGPAIRQGVIEKTSSIPSCTPFLGENFFQSIILNAGFRGFFSPLNLVPLFLMGVLLFTVYQDSKDKTLLSKRLAKIAFGLLALAFITHSMGYKVDFYKRTPNSLMIEASVLLLVFAVYELSKKSVFSKILDKALLPFGRNPLVSYLAHFVLVLKPLQVTGVESTFGIAFSLTAALVFIVLLNFGVSRWQDKT